jgi:hypothetical protein
MHSLRDLQERFAEVVFNPRSYGLALPIRENGLNGRRRVRVYRHNVFASLTEALRACYPVVERLVGAGFFAYVANRYIRSHPCTSGDVQEFGAEFPEFLEDFPTTRALVYLSDVARLEWARQYVYHALEPEIAEPSARLQAVSPNRYGDLRFRLHPAGQLLFSPYPILRIWQVNQEDHSGEDERVDLSEGAVYLLIIRRGLAIEMKSLSSGEYLLLDLLGQGHTITEACEKCLTVEPEFELADTLRRHITVKTLVGFSL